MTPHINLIRPAWYVQWLRTLGRWPSLFMLHKRGEEFCKWRGASGVRP